MMLRRFSQCAVLATLILLSGCSEQPSVTDADQLDPGEYERGPHRGRMLRDGDFAIEVTIFETGVPPQFRLYAYRNDTPIPAATVDASIVLTRLGGIKHRFAFAADGDVLIGDGVVVEPHSFDVQVVVDEDGRRHDWSYASYEGRTVIASDIAEASGLTTELAGPATIRSQLRLMGRVAVDENRVARIRARFPGAVRAVLVEEGARVKKGDLLATIEANSSLSSYSLTAPSDGVVTLRATNVGDVAGDGVLFEIVDLSRVWVNLHAFGEQVTLLSPGQTVRLEAATSSAITSGSIDRLLPVADHDSQSAIARVDLSNPDGVWRPGLVVSADVNVAEHPVPLAVRSSGLQPFRDFTVVFAQVGETYEVRMLELGRADPDYVEVLGGLESGERYVTEQSFLIRQDIEKSGASHDH